MAHALERKPRNPAQDKTAPSNYAPLNSASLKLPQQTADGQPTIASVYRILWPKLRVIRKLARSTAKRYDSVMAKQILPQMNQEIPFCDWCDFDFLALWDCLCRSHLSKSSLQIASIVIRTMMDLAYEQSLTLTTLWGLPQYQISTDTYVPMETSIRFNPENEGQRLANLAIHTPRSISLDVEIALAKGMIDNCPNHGELIAGLIMLCLGCRTSEATGFSYKHFVHFRPGYWALVRYEISGKDSRVTQAGGKTNNAFRLLPLPQFLANLLCARRKELEARYSPETVEDLPLACKGTDEARRCTQRELNQKLISLYQQTGVAEDFMRTAYQDMREDPNLAEDCEGRATAYLCRHQFATAMVYCGLSQGEIYSVMGHAEEDEWVHKSDYSNPDAFCALADKMSRRPLVQILDQHPSCQTYQCEARKSVVVDADGDIELRFPNGGQFHITLSEAEYDTLELEPEHMNIMCQTPICLPGVTADTLSIRGDLRSLADQAWKAAVDKTVVLPRPDAVINRLLNDDRLHPQPLQVNHPPAGRPKIPASQATADVLPVSPQLPPAEQIVPTQNEQANVPVTGQPSAPARSDKHAPKVFGMAAAPGTLYLLDVNGKIWSLSPQQPVLNRARAGNWLIQPAKVTPVSLLCYRASETALVLSPDGMIYRITPGQPLDDPEFCQTDQPAYQALRSGGILLQGPELDQPDGTITCMSCRGSIRRVSLERFQRIRPEGRQLVSVPDGDHLVSACLSSGRADLLMISAQGKALRVSSDDLLPVTTPGSSLYAGMVLAKADRAVLCRPYKPHTAYLLVTRFGRAVRLAETVEIMSHGRGSQGAQRVLVKSGDQLVSLFPATDALFMVTSNGKGLCIRTDHISATVSVAQGVEAIALKASNSVLTAIGMDWCHAPPTDAAPLPASQK